MNCAFLFYGKPCSGKDTFINLLLRKRKQLQLFLYLFKHLVHKNESYVHLREKVFFIQLIKQYHRIGNRKGKLSTIWGHGGETDRTVSFRFLVQLTKHLLRIWRGSGWDPGAGSKRGTRRRTKRRSKTATRRLTRSAKNGRAKEQLACEAPPRGAPRLHNPTLRKIPQRNPLRRTKLSNQSSNFLLICYLYRQKDQCMCHYRSYLRRNKIKTFNVSLDFIEKQLYRGHPREETSLSPSKVNQRQLHLLMNKRYTVYGREKHNWGVFYPIVKRTAIKGGHTMLIRGAADQKVKGENIAHMAKGKNIAKGVNMAKRTNIAKGTHIAKPTCANQVKCWRTARRIAYAYCASLMQAQSQRSSSGPRGGMAEHAVILLNDTFHLPSMRKKYYHLCRRYHFNYAQIYLNAPLNMCLERNRRRKKFKPIADKTIVRNHFYHQKYAVRLRGAGQSRSPNRVSVVRGGRKWQKSVFSIQVDSSAPKKLTDVLRLIYNHVDEFRNEAGENQTHKVQEVKRENLPNRVDLLNLMINKIIHEKLKSLPNERKNECAKKFRVVKLRLLREYRDGKDYFMEDLDHMFVVE
ncbi:L-seryl-tRNA(Sec) kinase, putative [Plasmodium vivax]|uniref:L-seryl-tRNA(Sec) kinase, putative n=1 Tax=Plasmodium vivax TaxID=5855 RepID=A0A1G4GRF0_PLAVI|nr:L-seryl-tRNA(Sec) kinase, putative [Plasmodium vivax]